ncbi:MAG: hypothetical protein QOF71_2405 [Candidatus Eremiobacteraeota bacterium]|nr:hypothetical protein [Candidatus Eremiobacteraeota bacterium]
MYIDLASDRRLGRPQPPRPEAPGATWGIPQNPPRGPVENGTMDDLRRSLDEAAAVPPGDDPTLETGTPAELDDLFLLDRDRDDDVPWEPEGWRDKGPPKP